MKNQCALVLLAGKLPQIGLWQGLDPPFWSALTLEQKIQGSNLLAEIVRLLANNEVSLTNLTSIGVMPGPASYTQLRLFVSTANTLAWNLGLPIFTIQTDSNIPQDLSRLIGSAKVNQVIKPVYPTKLG